MKIKQIAAILKSNKRIVTFLNSDGVQWLSNGHAAYPVQGLPTLNKDQICTMFDIPEGKREGFLYEELTLDVINQDFMLSDTNDSEEQLETGKVSIAINGAVLVPLITSKGAVFINSKYLKPFEDINDGYELYERIRHNGAIQIAVKSGLLLIGIIMPYDVINKGFVEELENIATYSAVSYSSKNEDC